MIRSEIRTIAYLGVAIPVGVTTIVSAILANTRFRRESRLPIQWWLDGKVIWSAPRAVTLAFIPVLATGVLGVVAVLSQTLPPRAGQEALVWPVMLGSGALSVAIQFLHLGLIARTVRRPGR
jgi:hypothetical protein